MELKIMAKTKVNPTPTTTPYDPDAAARANATPVPFTSTGTSAWTTGGNVTIDNIENRRAFQGVNFRDRWQFSPLPDGTITSTDTFNSNVAMETTAILGDYGNRNSPWQNGVVIHSLESAVSAWAKKNAGKDTVSNVRATLIAKGWISGDSAKITGNFVDEALINALNGAAANISYRNYNRLLVGQDLLTLDEGIVDLASAPSTSTGSGFGGTSTRIMRQEFKPEDYRIEVDKAYRDITGQGASDSTLDTYIKVLQKLEAADPMKQVSTTTGTPSNNKTVTKETGGVSQAAQEDILLKQAIAEPETEYYQKATTFMDYFNEAIKTKVNL
jgi:hypothetical protein